MVTSAPVAPDRPVRRKRPRSSLCARWVPPTTAICAPTNGSCVPAALTVPAIVPASCATSIAAGSKGRNAENAPARASATASWTSVRGSEWATDDDTRVALGEDHTVMDDLRVEVVIMPRRRHALPNPGQDVAADLY